MIERIFFCFIFVFSSFFYFQATNFKIKSINNQIYETYNLLIQFNALLEAKIDFINSNELASKSVLNTLLSFLLFAGVCFALYYFFSGGGSDPKDTTSSSSNNVSRSNSTDSLASTSLDTESVNVLNIDETVSNLIGDSVVKQWIDFEKEFPLSENKEDLNFFKEQSQIVKDALLNKNSLEPFAHLDLVNKSLNDFKDVVFSLTSKLEKFSSDKNVAYFEELETIAEGLVDVLEAQSNSGTLLYENTPVLCSVALFYGLLYESQFVIKQFDDVFQGIGQHYKTYLETLPLETRNTPGTDSMKFAVWSIETFLQELRNLADSQPFAFFKTIDFKESFIVKFFKLLELNSFFK